MPDAKESKMFGANCIKAPNGKAVAMAWKEAIVFKLEGKEQEKALQLKGAKVFTPMEGRPMGGWIQIPLTHADKFPEFAAISMELVKKIEVIKKKVLKGEGAKGKEGRGKGTKK